MVLTVTINPLLEKRLFFSNISLGKNNRCFSQKFTSGGKGINVSRQLNCLRIPNHAFTFLGGNNGKQLRHCLSLEKIDFTVASSKDETRIADVIIEQDAKRVTTFFGMNSSVTKEESEDFKSKLDKMIQNCSTVVFSGSSACAQTDDIFSYGISLAHEYDKTSVLDTYGTHLQACLDAAPTVVHNNVIEVEQSLGISLSDEQSKIGYLNSLYKKGIKLCFLTDGANNSYASKFDYVHKIISPQIDTVDSTGSGDAFTAGIVYGLENALVFDEFIKIAAALGTANAASFETCNIPLEEIDKYVHLISVESIGKKMKLIDDSSTVD